MEYKIRADEIKALIGEGRYAEAVKIADTIDWKRVKSVSMLCTISDLYKINRRFEESRDVLLMAYDKHPTGRPIVYSLCELAIKMGEFVQAVEYYKEFVRIAPRDTGRYILQYKLYEAQEVSLEERIAVLEEFKKHDYRERWAYELAYLYHRVGLTTECVEECDEMFLWFGEGRYVMKALELKALHEPLSPEQQDRYNRYKIKNGIMTESATIPDSPATTQADTAEIPAPSAEYVPDGKQPTKEMPPVTDEVIREYTMSRNVPQEPVQDTVVYEGQASVEVQEPVQSASPDTIVYPHINEIKEPSVDVSAYNTMNLQETLAAGLKEIYASENNETSQEPVQTGNMQEIFFDTQTVDIPTAPQMGIDIKYGGNGPILGQAKEYEQEEPSQAEPVYRAPVYEEKPLEDEVPGAVIHPNASYQMPSHLENILAQESDGQISMAVQPEPEVEKQITGQISIEEYLGNWEKFKKDQQEKQFAAVKKRVADETGNMFADFDEQTREGLQEKIEKAITDALKKEQYEKASGRGDWSVNKEDVINAAVDEVIDEAGQEELPISDSAELDKIPDEIPEEVDADRDTVEQELAAVAEEEESEVEAVKSVKDEVTSEDAEKEEAGDSDSDDEEDKEEIPEDECEGENPTAQPEPKPEPGPEISKKAVAKSEEENGKKHLGNREIEERVRTMTPEEKELFGPYIHHKKSRRQIINAIDNLSMDAFTGNAIVTGEEGAGTVNLAKGLIKAVQASDSNFSGKVAKITANTLNKKSTSSIFDKLANGALIIQRAADLNQETVNELLGILQEENKGLIIIMEDTKEDMDRFLDKNPSLKQSFNVRVDIQALDDDSLVAYARQYAYEKEYAIDNLGILALHTRISERQTLDHEVTVAEVKDIVDDAIYYAEKRSLAHFVDVLVNKRYDENDMVILREKDFMR